MKTTAAVLRDPAGAYAIEEVDLGEPRDDEVLVRVVASGLCHTDVVPRSTGLSPFPIVTGHEGAGVVEAVGASVEGVAVGDHVVLSFDSCGTCPACAAGVPAHCETMLFRNLVGRRLDGTTAMTDGSGDDVSNRWFGQSSFATHCLATARNVVVVDPGLPLERLGPLGCGVQTGAGSVVISLAVQPGESLVVLGAGAVGLSAVMAGVVAGATTIVAVDLHAHRLDLARELGATHVVDASEAEVAAEVLAVTGVGAHAVLDTTGVPDVMRAALAAARPGGRVGFVGVQTGDLVLDPLALVGKVVHGILEGGADPQDLIPRMIGWWQDGRFPFDRLIETFPLAEINEAEEASLSGRVVKPVLLTGA